MYNSYIPRLLFATSLVLLGANFAFSQSEEETEIEYFRPVFRPKIHLGAGNIQLYGDVGRLGGLGQSSQLNWGQHIAIRNPLNDAFELNVFALFGKITAAERLTDGFFNVQNSIRMGGLQVSYNFDHLLPAERILTPFLSLGISTFEFNPKSNMRDQYGRQYHYWQDGSIRSLDEGHPNAANAIHLEQNDVYETDLRSLEEGYAYALRSFSIPLSLGVDIAIDERFSLRLATEYHFTRTDYLDGKAYNAETQSGRPGNDHFLYSSFGLSYTFVKDDKDKMPFHEAMDPYADFEVDEDSDGVPDFWDRCPFTPEGAEVDWYGCPLDSDGDGVPDYRDDEPDSAPGAVVDERGVTLSEEDLAYMYRVYQGLEFDQNFVKSSTSTEDVDRNQLVQRSRNRGYRLIIQTRDEMDAQQLTQLLSIAGLRTEEKDGETSYFLGDYSKTEDVMESSVKLKSAGFEYDLVYNDFGNFSSIDESLLFDEEDYSTYAQFFGSDKVTFRVQVGAFSKKVSKDLFKDIPDLLVIPGSDGLTRFVSGSFEDLPSAAKNRVELLLKGYEGAFVTAYRQGKRITLQEAGATMTETVEKPAREKESASVINPELVKYTLQLGEFTGRIPAETLSEYMALGNVKPLRSEEGITRYIYGQYDSFAEAEVAQRKLIHGGFDKAAVQGLFKGQLISADEARSLKNE